MPFEDSEDLLATLGGFASEELARELKDRPELLAEGALGGAGGLGRRGKSEESELESRLNLEGFTKSGMGDELLDL